MNTKILERIQNKAKAFPAAFDMHLWTNSITPSKQVPCGTIGCIAGHIVFEETGKVPIGTKCLVAATELLKVDSLEAYNLFYLGPERLAHDYRMAECDEDRAKVICKRIDLFIQTDGEV